MSLRGMMHIRGHIKVQRCYDVAYNLLKGVQQSSILPIGIPKGLKLCAEGVCTIPSEDIIYVKKLSVFWYCIINYSAISFWVWPCKCRLVWLKWVTNHVCWFCLCIFLFMCSNTANQTTTHNQIIQFTEHT